MSKKRNSQGKGELAPVHEAEMTILPPAGGIVGEFLTDTENMFRARSMRMKSLFARINETGQRMEGLLRMAAERIDAAEARLEDDLRGQGLLADTETEE